MSSCFHTHYILTEVGLIKISAKFISRMLQRISVSGGKLQRCCFTK
uniref:Uncharacterized protein n=1 Tax=Arundo donax TaxID=35708 RepID=A0A0A9AM42_ARUDO